VHEFNTVDEIEPDEIAEFEIFEVSDKEICDDDELVLDEIE